MADLRRLGDVYGVSRGLPENYVQRPSVDGALIDSLTRDKHIVIFGSSKQGKTSLRKWNLQDNDYVVVTCSNKWTLSELHTAILKSAGFTVEKSTTRSVGGESKIQAQVAGRLKTPFAELDASLGTDRGTDAATSKTEEPLELDPSDVNDVIKALQASSFKKYVVLEDFHYLPEDTQRDFSFALKAFHEGSDFSFIIVGVWLDENRLIQYNGDLSNRVIAIDADAWAETELRQVISLGAQLLNITFNPTFVSDLIASCFESVWVVQEVCYRACEIAQVFNNDHALIEIGDGASAPALAKEVVDTQSARYNTFFGGFADGFMPTALEMYRWLLLPVIVSDLRELEAGLGYSDIRRLIDRYHPSGPINAGNLTQALNSTASLQVRLSFKPLILDYNQSRRRLDIVDKSFLIWLQHQSSDDLLSTAGLPVPLVAR